MIEMMGKKKILHIVHGLNIGGMENGLVNLINNSDAYEHHICCLSRSGKTADRLRREVNIYSLEKKIGNDWRLIYRLVCLIREINPDIVHTRNWGSMDGILSARLAMIKNIVHSEHGWSIDDPFGLKMKRIVVRRLLGYLVKRFVALSGDIERWLHDSIKIPKGKIVTIINGVDDLKFCPGVDRHLKEKYDLNINDFVIGIVARLDPIKRHDLLLRAFSSLDHERYQLKLFIVGDGEECENLVQMAHELPYGERICFWGEREDVRDFYKVMDVFVLPSMNEGISNTILEAMSSGVPVIATDVGGNPELVTDGSTGKLINPESVDELAKAMAYYLENQADCKRHGINARVTVQENFSLKKMVDAYETLYGALLSL